MRRCLHFRPRRRGGAGAQRGCGADFFLIGDDAEIGSDDDEKIMYISLRRF